MRLRAFLLMIAALVRRLSLIRAQSHRQLFIDLAPMLISAQDISAQADRAKLRHLNHLLTPYRNLLGEYVRELASGREAHRDPANRAQRLPRGCRLGKLHLSPLVQLAKLAGAAELRTASVETLPRTFEDIYQLLLARIGLGASDEEAPAFKTLFGFDLCAYAGRLFDLRGNHPVLFVMLLANEFSYARDWARDHCRTHLHLVDQGARLAELERLVEIVSYAKSNPQSLAELIGAVRVLAKGSASRRYRANLRAYKRLLPYIEQLGCSTEGVRALFLGDAGGPPLIAACWSNATREMLLKAAARCAWFAKSGPVLVHGFRQPAQRFIRRRTCSAYTYYGIPLDALLAVGICDLARACGTGGGIHSVHSLASAIHQGIFGEKRNLQRLAHQAVLFEEVYLRELGHGGSSNRFDPRYWFENPVDEALYARLWRLFSCGSKPATAGSVRNHIKSSIAVLGQLLVPHWRKRMPTASGDINRVFAQLACGLTPVSMDPIFAVLVERSLVERAVPARFRKDPSRDVVNHEALLTRYLSRFLHDSVRSSYARFIGADGRLNHVSESALPPALITSRKTLPRPLRRAATSAS